MKIANQINNNQQFHKNQSFGMKFTPKTLTEMGTMTEALGQRVFSPEHLSTIASLCSHAGSDEFLISIRGLVEPKRSRLSRLVSRKAEPVATITVSSTKDPLLEAVYARFSRGNGPDNLAAALELLKHDADSDWFQLNAQGAIDYIRKYPKK